MSVPRLVNKKTNDQRVLRVRGNPKRQPHLQLKLLGESECNVIEREPIKVGSSMNHQAAHHVFVPVTDDLIYNHPEQIEGPLVPYFAGVECQNWLAIEINPDENIKPGKADKRFKRTAKLRLAYSA